MKGRIAVLCLARKPTWSICLTLWFALTASACSTSEQEQPIPDSRVPNIVLIVADDLGHGHLGSYGQQKIKTPHLDRMASEGMRFTQAYAGESVCAPSRSVLMTGLHNGHSPIRANGSGLYLYPEDVTIAEVLAQSGYTSGVFGKWGLGDVDARSHPNEQGFNQFFGQLHQIHAHFYYPTWVWQNQEKHVLEGNLDGKRGQYVQDEIHARALDFIRENKDRPFFAYMPNILPHVELVVPEESEKPYRDQFPVKNLPDLREGYIGSEHAFATYAGMISHLDQQVGEVLALLEELELDEQTLVIFTSDNGTQGGHWDPLVEFFDGNGELRGTKGDLYEGGIRVPMIARWPGRIQPDTTTDHVTYFPDLMPTLAEVAGTDPPSEIDGISFLPALLGQEQPQHDYLYWAHYRTYGPLPQSQAVRFGKWKAVQPAPEALIELYDLTVDLQESNNLAPDNPEMLAAAQEKMRQAFSPRRVYEKVDRPPQSSFFEELTLLQSE